MRYLFKLAWAVVWLAPVAALPQSTASAQSSDDLVGRWQFVSSVTEKDGARIDQFGAGATGMMCLDRDGHFMLTIIGADLPKFASNTRTGGTAEENKAVMSKTIAMIGTYVVSRKDNLLTFSIESATFPNWIGTEQKRSILAASDTELKYTVPITSTGGVGTVTWKRAR